MKTLKDLKEHLEKYKDTVIIIGPGVQPNTNKEYTVEEFNENYTRKKFKREPEKLWSFFIDKLYHFINEKDVNTYVYIKNLLPYSSLLIDQNMNSPVMDNNKVINLHGSIDKWSCPKCKITYTSNYVIPEDRDYQNTCEVCGSYIRPTALFVGEKYNQKDFDKIKDCIADTHTLFLIGVDYTEETILKLLEEYGVHKTQFNIKHPDDEKMIVCIQSKEEDFDPNELTFCEFLVRDDIELAMDRLIKGINKI